MRRHLSLVLAIALLPGCATYYEHLADGDHWWHAGPMYAGVGIGFTVFLPLAVAEDVITGSRNFAPCPDPGIMGSAALGVGLGLGFLLGTPFYVLGLPFEGGEEVEGQEEDPGPVPPVPPELRDEGSRP